MKFQLWFPFSPLTIGIQEQDIPQIHNRMFTRVLASITQAGQWQCEQVYLTDRVQSYQLRGDVHYRFFPVSFRWRDSSRRYAYQWSLAALWTLLRNPPSAMAIFSAYGMFAKALALMAQIRRVPYIVIVGGWYNRISKSQKWYFDHSFRVLVHTEMQRQALVNVGYSASSFEIFPLGIDTGLFCPKPVSQDMPHPDWPRLLYVGRLHPSKGPFAALQTFEVIKRHYPHASLRIVGSCNDEPFLRQMREYVEGNGLQDSVEFTGPVVYDNLPKYYQAADLFLFPSPYEGLPSVVLESMACGTPPIVLRGSGGTEEAVIDGEVGWVVDMPRLAYDVLQILSMPDEIRRAGENAARRIREVYSSQRTYKQLAQILDESLTFNRKRNPRAASRRPNAQW